MGFPGNTLPASTGAPAAGIGITGTELSGGSGATLYNILANLTVPPDLRKGCFIAVVGSPDAAPAALGRRGRIFSELPLPPGSPSATAVSSFLRIYWHTDPVPGGDPVQIEFASAARFVALGLLLENVDKPFVTGYRTVPANIPSFGTADAVCGSDYTNPDRVRIFSFAAIRTNVSTPATMVETPPGGLFSHFRPVAASPGASPYVHLRGADLGSFPADEIVAPSWRLTNNGNQAAPSFLRTVGLIGG